MARTALVQLCKHSLSQTPDAGRRRAVAAAAAAAAVRRSNAVARADARGFAISTTTTASQKKKSAAGDGHEDEVVDEATAKRAALLKRYGDRTPPLGPIAVKVDTAKNDTTKAGGFDVKKAASAEVNHNEIWGDYVSYMEHQRKMGWKT